jgi:Holliday junction resolvasome RuvABC ATP-dependent DNA helicase subunit
MMGAEYDTRKEIEFNSIQGYDDIKDIVKRALDAEDNYNLLFIGPPASAKTLFLLGILESRKGVYFDGINTTNRILDVLEEKRPKIICIDELDKMPKQFQEKLLNFMESGHIKVDQMRRQYDFKIKGAKVVAACNEIARLSRPLQSRFRRLHLPPYSEQQFLEVSSYFGLYYDKALAIQSNAGFNMGMLNGSAPHTHTRF